MPTSIATAAQTHASASTEANRRRLIRHGFFFLFLAIWLGIATTALPHARAWLAAHLTAFFTGLILIAIGLVWRELRLTDRQRSIALAASFMSAYVGLTGNTFIALTDLPGPVSAPGVPLPMPLGAVFLAILTIIIASTLTAFGLMAYGMRPESEHT